MDTHYDCPGSRYGLDFGHRFARLGDEAIDDKVGIQSAHVVLHDFARHHRSLSSCKHPLDNSMTLVTETPRVDLYDLFHVFARRPPRPKENRPTHAPLSGLKLRFGCYRSLWNGSRWRCCW